VADLTTNFAGIHSPNPFWLASAPPTNTGEQVMRAFDAGWGGAVWKTIGEPITNVSSRYSSIDWNAQRMMGLNNIELITDRPIETNLREIAEVKRRYPKHAVIASLMVESKRKAWHEIVKRAEGAGADGLELNFGCPHGMSERGMGSAVGQVPEYTQRITEWVKEAARTPCWSSSRPTSPTSASSRARPGAPAPTASAPSTPSTPSPASISTPLLPRPNVDGKSSHGGYCGPAVKPIALNMVQQVSGRHRRWPGNSHLRHRRHRQLAGCGGVSSARLHLGAGLHGGDALRLPHRRGDDRRPLQLDGREGIRNPRRSPRQEPAKVTEWKHLNLNYKIVARIDEALCIGCQLCHIACWDGAHQCIHVDRVSGPIDGPVELHAKPRELAARRSPSRRCPDSIRRSTRRALRNVAGTDSARRRDGVRRLQPLLAGLPRRRLHQNGRAPHRPSAADLGGAQTSAECESRRGMQWEMSWYFGPRESSNWE
jgi:dihydropyrimidine dehydrogenase (NAD+) subunit PreA